MASSDGFPWVRLATGVFAVAISLGMSWRAERMPVELARTQAPQPQQEQTAAADLDRQELEIVAAAAPDTLSPPVTPTLVARTPPNRPPASQKRHQLQRTTTPAKMRAHVVAHRNAGLKPHSNPVAHAKLIRTRSDLRREYIQAREQVAALTSEDSGSAYLTRLAARQRAARTNLAHYAHSRSPEGRRAPARS